MHTITGSPKALAALSHAMLLHRQKQALDALCDALPYIEDVLNDPAQLRCFKAGTVEKHAAAVRNAIESLSK